MNYFRESLEEENKKLLDIIRKRDETVKKLEERARSALEISIHADNGTFMVFKRETGRPKQLYTTTLRAFYPSPLVIKMRP